MITIGRKEIENILIHRHENILIDSVTYDPNDTSTNSLDLTISSQDSLGRDIFSKQRDTNKRVISCPVYMEVLALACIILEGGLKDDEMIIFTGIAQFKKLGDFPHNTRITGNCKKLSHKQGFFKYRGSLFNGSACIGEGSMMAFLTQKSEDSSPKKKVDLPPITMSQKMPLFEGIKSPAITVLDELVHISNNDCVTKYTYPINHPFVRGHFPGKPLMMGIMQWMGIEDAVFAFARMNEKTGKCCFLLDGDIIKEDGTLIADVSGVKVMTFINIQGFKNHSEIIETRKITFRSMVTPNETIYFHCKNIQEII